MTCCNSLSLLQNCLSEILLNPLHWDNVLKGCGKTDATHAKVLAVGPTNLAPSMLSVLKSAGVEVDFEDSASWGFKRAPGPIAMTDSPIAIVGMAGRFPDAADHEAFWKNLEAGLDLHREVPPDRYNVKTHTDPNSKIRNTSHTPFGNFIKDPGLFDARFFNMSPREAAQTDPMQRLMLVTAYEAMEMGGIVPGRTPSTKRDRIGTFYGQTSDDWREINAAQDIDTYFISGGVRAFGPGRLNYFFKFSGPSFSVDTACSSSFAALNIACTSLRAGECDMALSGGANVLTNPDIFCGLSRGHFLSKTGSCKTFDETADGYCRGDGVCSIILKRLDDALADNDPVLGVIRGTGTNHSADAVSITHPCAKDQAFLFSKVLAENNVDPHDVSYVEMHGTGTQAGDGIEMESVTSVFAPRNRRRKPDNPVYLGAVKANIGHGEAVSGVSALIKVLLMLQKNTIPPHAGVKTVMNKTFPKDLGERGVNIAFRKTPFPRPAGGKRIVFLNNFSAAGGNTAVVMEDGPEKVVKSSPDVRSTQLVAISAKSLAAFRKSLQRFSSYVKNHADCDLADLSYTTTARRNHYNYRIAFAVSTVQQLSQALETATDVAQNPIPLNPPQLAFAYTGQGSQYTAMGKTLYETSKQFRQDINEYDSIAVQQGFPSFKPLIDGSEDVKDARPAAVQLGMTCIQMALTRLWSCWGLQPSVVIGHSLGEYAALNAAGVLSVFDTIYLVGKRATLLEEMCTVGTHAMLAIKAAVASLSQIMLKYEGKIELACINGASEIVLSGRVTEIEAIASDLSASGIKSTKLALPFAFHSSQVECILPSFEAIAATVTYHRPRIPIISPLLSDTISEIGSVNANYLTRHCRGTVDFLGSLTAAMAKNVIEASNTWVEVGTHPICSNMVKSTLSAPVYQTLRRDEDPWRTISNAVCGLYTAGLTPDFNAYHKGFDSLSVLNIPTYGFDEKVYWLQYEGDWCLSKGGPQPARIAAEPEINKFSTTSVQMILSEKVEGSTATVQAQSDLGDPLLHKVVAGHLMNGAGLCPSSLYADMALGVTEYAYSLLRPGQKVDMNLGTMDNPNPLLLKNIHNPEEQLVHMEVKVDLTNNKADFVLTTGEGKAAKIHAKCVVMFEDATQWTAQWQRNAYLIKERMKMLRRKMENGDADKIGRKMAYKLFAALVTYSERFQGMKEIVLDSPELEGVSTVQFQAGPNDGSFYLSPYFIDSTAHLSGFIVNATADSKSIYISHGWESMRYARKLDTDKTYNCYVKMQPAGGKMVAGDVYIFDPEDNIVGVVGGLRFQCIPRQLLSTLLPSAPSANKTKPQIQQSTVAKKLAPVSITEATKKVAAAKSPKARTPKPSQNSFLSKAMDIIAAELAVDQSELADSIQWADLGVDSLMSLTISGRFREELDLELPSTLFTDFASVGELKKHLSAQSSDIESDSSSSTDFSEEDSEESGITTPDSEYVEMKATSNSKPAATARHESDGPDVIATIRSTIAEEMEIDLEEIAETTDLNSLGMDSLMSLTILGSLREKCGLELEPTVLADNPSLGHLRTALGLSKPVAAPPQAHTSTVVETIPDEPHHEPVQVVTKQPPATSIVLQGNLRTATKSLFLFPDGSGAAASYASIPPIDSPNLVVYGLNCPFMKDPTSYTCGIEGVSKLYLEEVLRRQPTGPYYLGGWSAGGVVAYEVCRQLDVLSKTATAQGDTSHNYTVAKLILFDSPCPIRLEPLPARLHHFFDEIGLLGAGTGKAPSWLLPHFEYSIKALTAYKPELKSQNDWTPPSTLLIWATDGVCGNPEDPRPPPQEDDPKSMTWLLNNRADFGPNGWDYLLGSEGLTFELVKGNHFTMMKRPVVSRSLKYLVDVWGSLLTKMLLFDRLINWASIFASIFARRGVYIWLAPDERWKLQDQHRRQELERADCQKCVSRYYLLSNTFVH